MKGRGGYGNGAFAGYDASFGADNSHRAEARRVVAALAKQQWSAPTIAFGYMLGPRGIVTQAFSAAGGADPFWFAKDWYQSAIPHSGYVAWFDARDLSKPRDEHFGTVTMLGAAPQGAKASMSNERGHYGKTVQIAGETPTTVYVERKGISTGALILGAIAVGGAVLFARHQSQQIKHLYKAEGKPYQSFTGSLRESAKELPARAREAYRGFTAGIRPRKATTKPPASVPALPAPEQSAPAHSVRTRSGGR